MFEKAAFFYFMIRTRQLDKSSMCSQSSRSAFKQWRHIYAIHFLEMAYIFILFSRTHSYMSLWAWAVWLYNHLLHPLYYYIPFIQIPHSDLWPTFSCFPPIWQISIAFYVIVSSIFSWYTIAQNNLYETQEKSLHLVVPHTYYMDKVRSAVALVKQKQNW